MKVIVLVLGLLSVASCGQVRARVPIRVPVGPPAPAQTYSYAPAAPPAPVPTPNYVPAAPPAPVPTHTYAPAAPPAPAPSHDYAPAPSVDHEPVHTYGAVREEEERPEVKVPKRTYDYVKTRDNPGPKDRLRQQQQEEEEEEERLAMEASKNAKYNFATAVDDGIHDQSQVRQETRDGHKVVGSYKYSDGFVRRTVNYEADENGYRVVSELTEPIGEGPVTDFKNGKAEVHTMAHGIDTQYSVNADEIAKLTEAPPKMVQGQRQVQIASSDSAY